MEVKGGRTRSVTFQMYRLIISLTLWKSMVSRIKGTSVKNYCTATSNPVEEPAVIVTTGLEGGENMDAQRTQNLKLQMPAPGRNRPTQTRRVSEKLLAIGNADMGCQARKEARLLGKRLKRLTLGHITCEALLSTELRRTWIMEVKYNETKGLNTLVNKNWVRHNWLYHAKKQPQT